MRPPAGTLRRAFGSTAAHAFPEPGKTDVFLYGGAGLVEEVVRLPGWEASRGQALPDLE